MEFGFGLITCQRYPGDPRTDRELYAEALALAEEAERLGFDSVWVSEHHFVDDAYLPSLLPMCAAIAARTERIAIGTALVLAPLHEPLRLAEDAAVVDLLSGGRLVLGVGAGWREEEFEALGVPRSERGLRLEDTVTVLRQAWSDGVVTGGRRLRYPAVSVTPKPARSGGPPIWVGALAAPAIRRAGRIGDGFMATEVTPASFAAQVAMAREEAVRSGRDPGRFAVSLHVPTFAWRGGDAWELVRDHHRYVAWKYEDMEGARSRTGPPPAPPPLDPGEEEALRASILVGDPATVADGIDAFRRAAGDDLHFIARLYWPGMDLGMQREAMRCFAEEVIPLVRARA
ncbi:MAG TPA: LLM class flavin-dependent oxidoreductase [Actinomycetota bacterium]|nr:LLM class flavin-dependent oxidoreductase [Actinomycetota bacterium]